MQCYVTYCAVEVAVLMALWCLVVGVVIAWAYPYITKRRCITGNHPLTERRRAIGGYWLECQCGKHYRLVCDE